MPIPRSKDISQPGSTNTSNQNAPDDRAQDITILSPIEQIQGDDVLESVPLDTMQDTLPKIPSSSNKSAQFTQTFNVADTVFKLQTPFKIKSLRLHNLTNQWYYVPVLNMFIPPFYYNLVVSLRDIDTLTILNQAPGGIVQAGPTANTIFTTIAYLDCVTEQDGEILKPIP